MGVYQRGGHQFRRFITGVTEGDALIARPQFFHRVAANAVSNIGGLFAKDI